MQSKVIAIVGPTASGKTSLSIFLAQKLKGEVISADSRQVYKGLDVGTGKVTKKEMGSIPHHLLDVASPKKRFSVDDYVKKGRKALTQILENNTVPIIVGGTGLYVDALLGRITFPQVPPNPKLRARLEKMSTEKLFVMLEKLDPERSRNIDKHNPRRLVRAIEIATELSKKNSSGVGKFSAENFLGPRASRAAEPPAELLFAQPQVLWVGLNPTQEVLKKNIHKRLLTRMKSGMIAEAKRLHAGGLSYKRMEELGLEYRYLARFLQNQISKEEMLSQLESEIVKYTKRQMTWFKRNKDIHWVGSEAEALQLAKKFLT